jgi:hypothetical protein
MKTHVLTVSRYFPATHKRKGDKTKFVDAIYFGNKKHTIRSNFPLWEKRIKEVQEGKAILSLRYWSGKPYNSKQVEFAQLDKDSGVGIQKANLFLLTHKYENVHRNDGLSEDDFLEWFKKTPFDQKLAIIHFTNFRY